MTRRQDCLDLEHSLLVLRSLGRFHGMSKILEQRGVISRTDYKPYPLTSDKNLIKFFMYYGLQTLSKAMEDSWGPEWYDVAQKLKIPCDVLTEKMLKLGEVDETKFNCLNHGDCWSNNMMFKYDWQNRPYTMRFLDFQLCHYNSPAVDVTHFLYSAVNPSVRRQYYPFLIKTYYGSLVETLKQYHYQGSWPEFEDFYDEMNRMTFFGFCFVCFGFPIIVFDGDSAYDMETVIKTEGKEGFDKRVYSDYGMKRRIAIDVIELVYFIGVD